MEIRRFLAMTDQELAQCNPPPQNIGWMACHFSHDGGITNLPNTLPPHSLLILDDSVPPNNCDPKRIWETILSQLQIHRCFGLLLDFQRPDLPENRTVAKALAALPFPVAVSHTYGQELTCGIFLPPVPPDTPLAEYLAPHRGREVWLELGMDTLQLQLTPEGCSRKTVDGCKQPLPFSDKALHCHYRIDCEENRATFTLQRTGEDLRSLLKEAETLGVTTAVGLYQELK